MKNLILVLCLSILMFSCTDQGTSERVAEQQVRELNIEKGTYAVTDIGIGQQQVTGYTSTEISGLHIRTNGNSIDIWRGDRFATATTTVNLEFYSEGVYKIDDAKKLETLKVWSDRYLLMNGTAYLSIEGDHIKVVTFQVKAGSNRGDQHNFFYKINRVE